MDTLKIIKKYYKENSDLYNLLILHSQAVTKKALEIAKNVPKLKPDLKYIKEAAMLHDIGIFLTNAPELDCFGEKSYICHGYLGREVLEKEGLLRHALVCERHTGIGISVDDIKKEKLPLPLRDMLPVSVEEKIICLADKFFSKNKTGLVKEKSLDEIRSSHQKFGEEKVAAFNKLLREFEIKEDIL